jgi:hypothetical protein
VPHVLVQRRRAFLRVLGHAQPCVLLLSGTHIFFTFPNNIGALNSLGPQGSRLFFSVHIVFDFLERSYPYFNNFCLITGHVFCINTGKIYQKISQNTENKWTFSVPSHHRFVFNLLHTSTAGLPILWSPNLNGEDGSTVEHANSTK